MLAGIVVIVVAGIVFAVGAVMYVRSANDQSAPAAARRGDSIGAWSRSFATRTRGAGGSASCR